jgi:signal transduction histidine kinase
MIYTSRKSFARAGNQQAIQLRDNVLAIVAHDLRSPLSTITMAADLLTEGEADERRRHFLDMIVKAAAQADLLIKDLVDISRIEAGHLRVECEPEPLAYLVQSVVEQFEAAAAAAGVLLTCSTVEVTHVSVSVDHGRFVQLLSNLISNAIKFTPPGGSVFVEAESRGRYARVSVGDSGIGISAHELPHVFERFWQADHHRRAGAGLGLAIAKGIVKAHGGRIAVESKEGVGSTFFFTIPIVQPTTLDAA